MLQFVARLKNSICKEYLYAVNVYTIVVVRVILILPSHNNMFL